MVRNHRNGDGFTITHLLGRRVNHLPAVKLAVTGQVRPLHPAFTPHMEVPETKHWLPAGINKAVSALSWTGSQLRLDSYSITTCGNWWSGQTTSWNFFFCITCISGILCQWLSSRQVADIVRVRTDGEVWWPHSGRLTHVWKAILNIRLMNSLSFHRIRIIVCAVEDSWMRPV